MEFFLSINKPLPLGRGGTRQGVGEGELACEVVWPFVCSAGQLHGGGGDRCVGCGAVYICQRVPPFRRLSAPPSPKGDGSSLAPASQSLGQVRWLGGSLFMRASLPSLSLWDISPPRERLFLICTLCLCLLFPRGTAFSGSCFAVAGVVGVLWLLFLPYISGCTKKSHSFQEWDF